MKIKSQQLNLRYLCLLWLPCTLTIAQAQESNLVNLPDMVIESESDQSIGPLSNSISKSDFNRSSLESVNRADVNGVMRGLPSTGLSQANSNSLSGLTLRGASGGLGLVNFDGVPLFNNFTGFFH